MPATAGRVRMPAGNRMQTSSSLNTHGIWQNAIGYDPYAGEGEEKKAGATAAAEADSNAYQSMKGLLALAKLQQGATGASTDERGGWNGRGKLKGGWAAGKDLGEVVEDKPAAPVEMPSSTDSESSDESDGEGPASSAPVFASSSSGGDKKRKREKEKKHHKSEKKSKKEKKEKKHKKEKKKHKSEKKSKKHKRHSDSD